MSLLSALSDSLDGLLRSRPGAPGGATLSGGWMGGPATVDAYGARRAPTPYQLVESYKSLIYACVQINDNGVARVPLRLYADGGRPGGVPRSACDPRRVTRSQWGRLRALPYARSLVGGSAQTFEVNTHPILDTLDSPDPDGYFDRQQLISLIVRYCDVVGSAYLKPDGPASMPPTYLWPLAAQHVVPRPMAGGPLIAGYTYFADFYAFDELVRFRSTVSLKDPYKAGYSPTYAALEYAGLEDEWMSIQRNVLSNGARMSMLISAKDATMPIQEVTARRLEQDLDRQHARGNSGKPWVIRDAVEAVPVNWPPGDLSGLEITKQVIERTANCFGVPIAMLTPETNLANMQAAREHHASNAIEPRCKMIAAVLTRLVRKYDPRLFFAFDSAISEDEEKDAKVTKVLIEAGVKTINDERDDMGLMPVEWGDEPWFLNTMQQPSTLTETAKIGVEAAKAGVEQTKNATANSDLPASDALAAKSAAGGGDRSLPALHGAAVDARLDTILAAWEREAGL